MIPTYLNLTSQFVDLIVLGVLAESPWRMGTKTRIEGRLSAAQFPRSVIDKSLRRLRRRGYVRCDRHRGYVRCDNFVWKLIDRGKSDAL